MRNIKVGWMMIEQKKIKPENVKLDVTKEITY